MSYLINNVQFKLKELSLREDEKLANIINDAFTLQAQEANKEHQKNLKLANADIPFIQTQFLTDAHVITGGFLSKLLETKAALKIAEMILEPVDNKPIGGLWNFKKFRFYWLSKHIKGELKARIFTDFFREGMPFAGILVNHFLLLLANRIAQAEELKSSSKV